MSVVDATCNASSACVCDTTSSTSVYFVVYTIIGAYANLQCYIAAIHEGCRANTKLISLSALVFMLAITLALAAFCAMPVIMLILISVLDNKTVIAIAYDHVSRLMMQASAICFKGLRVRAFLSTLQ